MYDVFEELELTDEVFSLFKDLIYKYSGIVLSDQKKDLLRSRVTKRVRALGLNTYNEYYDFLIGSDQDHKEWHHFLNAITTNVTRFYRESQHYDFLIERVFPALATKDEINIWSAGCSNGAEPYSISFMVDKYLQHYHNSRHIPKYNIYGTDISRQVLSEALTAVYDEELLNEVPVGDRATYFKKGVNKNSGKFKVRSKFRQNVHFSHLNLLDRFDFPIEFDVIFCRNVMIYFDKETREKIVNKYFNSLVPQGYLFVGLSESLRYLNKKNIFPSVYMKH